MHLHLNNALSINKNRISLKVVCSQHFLQERATNPFKTIIFVRFFGNNKYVVYWHANVISFYWIHIPSDTTISLSPKSLYKYSNSGFS